MDNAKTKPARKSNRRPQRFQVDPLAELAMPAIEIGPGTTAEDSAVAPRFEQPAKAEIPLQQRIDILSLEDIQPDPWNPRHILPADIRFKYISGSLDARRAVQRWIKVGERNPEIADELQRYRLMGVSLLKQGQINPITVAKHFCEDGSFIWRIESGERRFWAKWLMVCDGETDECIIHAVLRDELNPIRQAVENLQTASLTAVSEARQVARLYLDRLGIVPDSEIASRFHPGSDEFFRMALSPASELLKGRQRLPRGFWPALEEIMGKKRQHLERKLEILKLPDELLSLVDTYQLTERQLREILGQPPSLWEQLIKATIAHDLTGPELALIKTGGKFDAALQMILERRVVSVEIPVRDETARQSLDTGKSEIAPEQVAHKRIMSFAKYFHRARQIFTDDEKLDQVVDDLIQSGDHQIVLESLESLLTRLRSRLAENSHRDKSSL